MIDLEELKQRMYEVKKITHDASLVLGQTYSEKLAKAQAVMDIIDTLAIEAAAYIIEEQTGGGEYDDE